MARRKKEQELQSDDDLCMAITPDNLKTVVKVLKGKGYEIVNTLFTDE